MKGDEAAQKAMKEYTKPAKIDDASSDPKVWSLAKLQKSLQDKGISGKHERSFDKAKQSAASLRAHLAQRLDMAEVDARSKWPLSGNEKNKHDSGGSSSTLNTSAQTGTHTATKVSTHETGRFVHRHVLVGKRRSCYMKIRSDK